MTAKSDAFENSLLLLIFNNTNIANIGDATGLRGSTAAGNLHLALHSTDPGEAGSQTTGEVAYTGYARVARPRVSGATGFNVSGNTVTLGADQDFPACTGGTATANFWSVGTASTGAGVVLYRGGVTPPISISNGVTPRLLAATNVTED